MYKLRIRCLLTGALDLMRQEMFSSQHGDRIFVPNFALLVTDGIGNVNKQNTVLEAVGAKTDGAHIILVTVGT